MTDTLREKALRELAEKLVEQRTINLTDINQVRAYLDETSILHHKAGPAILSLLDKYDAALAEIERLREALTPSGDTKAAYIGEFSMGVTLRTRHEEETRSVQIPWTTIKEIMAAIRARATSETPA